MKKTIYGITVTPQRLLQLLPLSVTAKMIAEEAEEQKRMVYMSYTLKRDGTRIYKGLSIVEKQPQS